MKKNSIFFILIIILLFSSSSYALDWEVYGGANVSSLEINNINNKIEFNNQYLKLADKEGHYVEKMQLNYIPGFHLGVDIVVTDKIGIKSQYERFNTTRKWEMKLKDTGYAVEEKWDFTLNGISSQAEYFLNDYIILKSGIGYYFGEQKVERKANTNQTYKIEFKGDIGYLLGLEINYEVKDNLKLVINSDYRILDLDLEDKDNYYSGNFEQDSFDGINLQFGMNYKF